MHAFPILSVTRHSKSASFFNVEFGWQEIKVQEPENIVPLCMQCRFEIL